MGQDHEDRTEQPTAARRREARRAGRVAFSRDLVGAVAVVAAFVCVARLGMFALEIVQDGVRAGLHEAFGAGPLEVDRVVGVCRAHLGVGLHVFVPLALVILGVTFLAGWIQTGFLIRPPALVPDPAHLSPRAGLARVVSVRGGGRGGFAILKLVWLAAVAIHYGGQAFRGEGALAPARIMERSPPELAAHSLDVVVDVAFVAAFGLLVLGVADWFFQRWQHERGLRMTRRELLQELKEQEPDPRVRQQQRRAARRLLFGGRSGRRKEGGGR